MKTITQNRIAKLFSKKKKELLSIYYTAGFPNLDDTVAIANALQERGVDMIEIGIPFSDPVADGPVIQESNKQALINGMNVPLLLDQVQEIRKTVTLPIVLMGYLNPILQYGVEEFCKRASSVGVDGLIIPDLPLYEYETEYKQMFDKFGLAHALLISPTTSEERIRKIDKVSSGFLYAVSSSSTTGARDKFSKEQVVYFEKLRNMNLENPFLIGFGISNRITFEQACEYADGAIIGSAFVSALQNGISINETVNNFMGHIRDKNI